MDPVTGTLIGLQLVGGYFAAQNIRDTAEINQEIADMNAEFAELDAYDARVDGYTQKAQYQKTIDKTLSEQQTILTAQDVDVNYGSASTIQKESRFAGEMNKMEIIKRSEEKALGYERQADQYRFRSTVDTAQAGAQASQVEFQSLVKAGTSVALAAEKSGAFKYNSTGYRNARADKQLTDSFSLYE